MDPTTQTLLGVLIILLSCPMLRIFKQRRKADIFVPLVLLSACLFYGYIFPLPAFLDGTDTFSLSLESRFHHFSSSLRTSVFVLIFGAIGLYIGYRSGQKWGGAKGKEVSDEYALLRFNQNAWEVRRLRKIGRAYTLVGLTLFGIGVVWLGGPSAI